MYQFDHILCATDFSQVSLDAIRFASFAVQKAGGSITLLYVDEYEKSPMGYYGMDERQCAEYRANVETFAVERFSDEIRVAHLNRRNTNFIVRFGTAYHEIIAEAEGHSYSAVALATQGIGCASPHLMGRTTERTVRICRAPVITLRPREHMEIDWRVRTILCPTDFSEYGNYALPYAISLARIFKAKLILLHVTSLTVSNPEKLVDHFPDPATYHESARDIVIEKMVGRDIEPENSIVQVVGDHDVDLVVIGTHGARGLRRVQIGNTTEEIIRRVEVPVLSITHPIHRTVFPRRFQEEYQK
jgi:nucleotide-binding universal stress UspA family protein